MQKFNYTLVQQIKFYLGFIYYKLIIFLECSRGVFGLYMAEIIWLLRAAFRINSILYIELPFFPKNIESRFGNLNISPDLMNTVIASPAFERQDVNYLISIMEKELRGRRKVLFLDIGASFGKYSILVGKYFRKKNVDIYAFEPDKAIYSKNAYSLLKENVKQNKLRNIKYYNKGISYRRGLSKKDVLTTLDKVVSIKKYNEYNAVFVKIDIDDWVIDGLKGIEFVVSQGKCTYLFVEDCVKQKSVVSYLEKHNYIFLKKVTPYNSFWIRQN